MKGRLAMILIATGNRVKIILMVALGQERQGKGSETYKLYGEDPFSQSDVAIT